jgi:hypothetical protein
LLDELATQVLNDHLGGANLLRLGANLVPVFLLADVGKEADDFVALLQKPAQDAAGVEAACAALVDGLRVGRRAVYQNRPGRLCPWIWKPWQGQLACGE